MKRLFFMHIPKCGGSSTIEGLYQTYNPYDVFRLDAPASVSALNLFNGEGGINEYRSRLLMYAMSSNQYKLIAGHFIFDERAYRAFSEKWSFITMIREPVSRFISHYFFNRFSKKNHYRINDELQEFLNKPDAADLGTMMLKYFSGSYANANIETAKLNANKFSTIGTLDSIDEFIAEIKAKHDIVLPVTHLNKNPKTYSDQQKVLSTEFMKQINKVCEPDIELYDYITSNILQ